MFQTEKKRACNFDYSPAMSFDKFIVGAMETKLQFPENVGNSSGEASSLVSFFKSELLILF